MPNRLPETELILDYAYLVRKDAMAAATHPDSEDRDSISPAEWERIQRADHRGQWLSRLSAGVEHAIRVLHNGLDAPSVQRGGRELFGRPDHDTPHDCEGMRR